MLIKVTRQSGDITLTVTIPAQKVKNAFAEVKKEATKGVIVPGFRKGRAPETLAAKYLDEGKLVEALFNHLIPAAYITALKQEKITPVVPPQIKVVSFKKDADLVFEARTAEKPEINLKDYKTAIKELKGKLIYGPDGKPIKGGAKITAAQVLEKLRQTAALTIPPIIIEQEVQRMLASLLEQTQTLGITIEQYLSAEGKGLNQLKKEYRETAERNLKDMLILDEVAGKEGIKPTPQEIEEAIKAAPDEKSREAFARSDGRRYIENILKRRKTIEYLLKIAEQK